MSRRKKPLPGQIALVDLIEDDPRTLPSAPPRPFATQTAAHPTKRVEAPRWRESPSSYRVLFWRGYEASRERMTRHATTLPAARDVALEGLRKGWEGAWIFED